MFWKPFNEEEEKEITTAIAEAEKQTSGEIRVHVERYCKGSPILKAENTFHHLKMDQTELRNGVLIFLAVEDHKFAIVGDKGIHDKVGSDFWESVKEKMLAHFRENHLVNGLKEAILEAGNQLAQHFPYQEDDQNELPDDISYG